MVLNIGYLLLVEKSRMLKAKHNTYICMIIEESFPVKPLVLSTGTQTLEYWLPHNN